MTAASPQSGLPISGTLDQNASSQFPFRRSSGGDEHCGDFGIRIARDGTWLYHGSPIGRKPLVRLFSSVLRRDDAGEYWLVTPVERGRIIVDDAPFTAVELTVSGSGRDAVLTFRTNIDDLVEVGIDRPIRVVENPGTGEPSPYVLVRDRLEALILRPVYYQLVELGQIEPPATGQGETGQGETGQGETGQGETGQGETGQGETGQGERFGVWSKGAFFELGRLDRTP